MEMNLTKGERSIAAIAFITIAVFFAMFIQLNRRTKAEPMFETGAMINYTMARPDQAYSEYTLDGRELDHSYESLENPTKPPTPGRLEKKKSELIAKKAAESKKKEEVKKKQLAQVKAQETHNKIKEQAQQSATEKSREKSEVKNDKRPVNNIAGPGVTPVPVAVQDNRVNPKPKKTYPEWRNMLFAAPTTENLGLFISAYRKNEVTLTEFQAMAQDLIDQSDLKHKAIGLMALRSVPSLASLSQLAHLQAGSLGSYQSYVEQSVMAYLQPQNLQFLIQALGTKNKTLLSKSLALLSTNLLKFSQGDFAGLVDPRNRREGEVITFSMNSYRSLLPALSQLGSSQEPEFSAQAQQIIALIQTSNNIAQN